MLYDAHNHLQDEWLTPHLDAIFATASRHKIAAMIVNGTHPDDWPQVDALATRFRFVRPAYGVHPWDVGRLSNDTWLGQLEARLATDPRASVGEIGIDRWILDSAKPDDPRLAGVRRASLDEQSSVFVSQLKLAARLNLPASIHCLQAWGALLELLKNTPLPRCGFLLHAYSGPAEMVADFAALGARFSFNTAFVAEKHIKKYDAFRRMPMDRLLIETDAPAMPPPTERMIERLPPARGGEIINHPANLVVALNGLSSALGRSPAEVGSLVEENFRRLFG